MGKINLESLGQQLKQTVKSLRKKKERIKKLEAEMLDKKKEISTLFNYFRHVLEYREQYHKEVVKSVFEWILKEPYLKEQIENYFMDKYQQSPPYFGLAFTNEAIIDEVVIKKDDALIYLITTKRNRYHHFENEWIKNTQDNNERNIKYSNKPPEVSDADTEITEQLLPLQECWIENTNDSFNLLQSRYKFDITKLKIN